MWVIRLCGNWGRELGNGSCNQSDAEQLQPRDERGHQSWILQIDTFLQSSMSWQFPVVISDNVWTSEQCRELCVWKIDLKNKSCLGFFLFSENIPNLTQVYPPCLCMVARLAFSRPIFGEDQRRRKLFNRNIQDVTGNIQSNPRSIKFKQYTDHISANSSGYTYL